MSGKGGKRPNQPNQGKKPSAIIDLKATEVRDGKKSGAAGETSASPSPAAKASASAVPGSQKAAAGPTGTAEALKAGRPASGTASAAKPTTQPSSSSASTAGPSAASKAAAGSAAGAKTSATSGGGSGGGGQKPGGSAAAPKKSGGGILSTLSHLVAAVVGGAIVLFLGEDLAKQAGLPVPTRTAEVPAEVKTRLAALEQASQTPTAPAVPANVTEKLGLVDQQAATIASLKTTVEQLQTEQAQLKKTTETAAAGGEGAVRLSDDVAARIKKLETTIETLSQAAGKDGRGGGRVAQLAALSGKLADLESTLQTQLKEIRTTVVSDIERRLTPAAEASEAARSGTQRVDRELAETKTELARVGQRVEALSATADRIDKAVGAVREETGRLTSEVSAVKSELTAQLAGTAKPADVSAAVAPITKKVTALESGLEQVVSKEKSREQDAKRVVLALELANLKRALDRGGSFETELEAVKAAAGEGVDLSALEGFKGSGVPTTGALSAQFRTIAQDLISASDTKESASWMDQMLAGAKSVVRVRRTGDAAAGLDPKSPEAIVARIEAA
ncbi:MAG: hypothetical protein AAFR70_13240, partial [Pseudomonadota bacterium]